MQVTATAGGSVQNGIALTVKVLTSASASQPGAVAGVAGTTPSQAITPSGTGSWVYGANLGLAGTYTANAATTPYLYDVAPGDGLEHVHMRTAATTTSGTPVTVGGTATANSISVALAELLAAGTLAEDASSPANVSNSAVSTISTAPFTPPAGAVLVAMVTTNGGASAVTMALTDTSGLGYVWTEERKQNASGGGYAGVWFAQVPGAAVVPGSRPAPAWIPLGPGAPGAAAFTPWPQPWAQVPPSTTSADVYTSTYTSLYGGPETPTLQVQAPPAWLPAAGPGVPGGPPFTPWPQYAAGGAARQDALNAAATVTATVTATLTSAPSPWELPPQYAPAWFPSAPSAPGGEPFTAWPLGQTGVNSASLTAASVITATAAAALTGSKPLNAASTITATGAAAETTAKPLNAAQTVTAAASASLTVVKAGVTPVPEYPAAWFPAAPGVPGGQPFAPWPVWSGFAGTSVPQDLLTAAAVITASRAAALTESKPLNTVATVTATAAASVTTAKPLNAAAAVTAAAAAALSDVAGAAVPAAMAPLYAPAWFPGAPGLPGEAFAPWPAWTGTLPAAVPLFTPGRLTASDQSGSLLTAATAPGSALTATSQPTGGPG